MKTKIHTIIAAAILLGLSLRGICQNVVSDASGNNSYAENASVLKDQFSLQVFPNPVRDHATVSYAVPENGKVIISIYNQMGEAVKVLADETLQRGIYTIDWNGADDSGNRLSRGVYIVKIQSSDGIQAEAISLE